MISKTEQAQKISNAIKKLRSEVDWNQARLAQEAGISGAALSKIEKGGERIPTIVVLRKLSAALKVPLHEITGEDFAETSETDVRSREFYRKWDVLDDLSVEDQDRLRDMAVRLKEITPKE
ncbi:XRE family transcriptional regulator [Kiloniella spongiae]|uniref:XRE family transcriptional regulator n=1 Tax=Kiloniella spongiae TaxID=1489064 RepID=A0A0H2MEW0_9PROT|nr:helix-turn-helix transcriptional regulator [Kiloniella spongiae]KLN60761.1 XRE family transcriptional regulator [Kiloniella spongiae]